MENHSNDPAVMLRFESDYIPRNFKYHQQFEDNRPLELGDMQENRTYRKIFEGVPYYLGNTYHAVLYKSSNCSKRFPKNILFIKY